MSLVDFLRLLSRHWRALTLVPAVAGVTTAAIVSWRTHEYESSTTLYTGFVSGYTLESGAGGRVDNLATTSAFDNLIQLVQSRQIAERVASKLLRLAASRELAASTPAVRDVADSLSTDDLEQLDRALGGGGLTATGRAAAILAAPTGPFAVESLQKGISVRRLGASDLVEIRLVTSDPRLSQRGLELLTEGVTAEFRRIKAKEAEAVLSFFEEQTEAAEKKLQDAVQRGRDFGVENRVINYYEQTKYIASRKEEIDHEAEQERGNLRAAEAVLRQLEQEMESRQGLTRTSLDLIETRRRLSSLVARRVVAEPAGEDLAPIDSEIGRLRSAIDAGIRELSTMQSTAAGAPREEIARRWLAANAAVEEARARLSEVEKQRAQYGGVYEVFAPLGSSLSGLEREVSIAQGEYLEMLRSLNQARMRQQNIDLAADLKVVDPPSLPERPRPAKRGLLIALALLAAEAMVLSMLIGAERFGRSLRTPERAVSITGLRLAGALATGHEEADVREALDARLLQAVELDLAEARDQGRGDAVSVLLTAAQPLEGVALAAARLADGWRRQGHEVLHLAPEGESRLGAVGYAVGDDFAAVRSIDELASRAGAVPGVGARRIVELPPLLARALPLGLLREACLVLVSARADRSWGTADAAAVADLQRALPGPIRLVLSGARLDRLEGVIGESPRRRGRLRRGIKRLARFEFGN